MAEFHVSLREQGGNFAVQFRTEPGLPSDVTELDVTSNGRYDAGEDAAFNPVIVDVPNTYTEADEGKVVDDGALVSQTSKSISANGTHDTTLNNQVVVDVPNSYSAADEGKVVSNGALVAQTAHAMVTENGQYDTTLNNSMTVAVEDPYGVCNCCGTKLSDIPDLSRLDRSSQVLYYIVDTAKYQWPLFAKFGVRPSSTGVLTVSRGYIGENGGFVEVESEVVASAAYYTDDLGDDGHRFWVYRLTSTGDITRIDNTTNTYVLDNTQIPIAAVYGNLPNLTTIAYGGFRSCMFIDVSAAKTQDIFRLGYSSNGNLIAVKGGGTFVTGINLFYNSPFLQNVDLSAATFAEGATLSQMFYACPSLRTVKLGNKAATSFTTIRNMFAGCSKLNTLDISGLNLSTVTETTNAFNQCYSLSEITGWAAIPVSYSLSDSKGLTHDSLMVVINALPIVETAQTLTLGTANTARLSAAEIAVATQKGWTVA